MKSSTLITILLIVVAVIVFCIWYSGYKYAEELVREKGASLLSISYITEGMSSLRKSGFMYYMEHKTDYNQKVKSLTLTLW